ncbi:MAG: hypothetical protein Q9Q13_08595 [Acidobacteriota bacterium]|nr:hypothetical protein [Acidobacteriota bacterium]
MAQQRVGRALVVLAAAALAFPHGSAADPRPMTPEDVARLQSVTAARISPRGTKLQWSPPSRVSPAATKTAVPTSG